MKNATHTTITDRQFKITANKSLRTFTIVTDSAKYKTYKMSKEEFNNASYYTGNDWAQFLKTDNYYKIK